jgi:mRNA-degrading endonuclease RelE of RelBE toxin-antitoxin system
MNVEYSKQFVKAAYKLSGKYKASLQRIVSEVKLANNIADLTDCIRMVGFKNSYRIIMGDYRLVLILRSVDDIAIFELLLSRGEVYKKEQKKSLKKKNGNTGS